MPPRAKPKNLKYRRNFIRQWRESYNLSQDQLVERVREYLPSFSKSTLSRLENAQSPYNQAQLEALAMALRCLPQDLLDRAPGSPGSEAIAALRALSPAEQAQIAQIIATFKRAS